MKDDRQTLLPDLPQIEAELRSIGAFQLRGYQNLNSGDIQEKTSTTGETTIVTRYDTESEQMLRDWIGQHFPRHSVLGEEYGNDVRDTEHYWIVDPIDGTTNFTEGIPFWGSSLAYWHRGRLELGLVYFPALDQMFTARHDGGSFMNGERIRTSTAREYTSQVGVALDSRAHLQFTLRLPTRVRILGSVVANNCYTALGTFVASQVDARLWDLAAGTLILQEAGAVLDLEPEIGSIDVPHYALDPDPGHKIAQYARANRHLPPLTQFLERLDRT